MSKLLGIFKVKRNLAILIIVLIVLVLIIRGVAGTKEKSKKQEETDAYTEQLLEQAKQGDAEVSDSLLIQMQDDLIKTYGQVPDGYVWDIDGELLSLGDKSMTAEDVVYSYMNGLRTLDFSTVQKYSRSSMVVDTYEGYFSETDKNTDYTDQFLRNMYREALLSMQVKEIENSSVFAENKQVFSVKVSMLDLTDKDFWYDDRVEIYKNLQTYDSDQADSTRAEMYLYDYIADYYASPDASKREVTFDLTVQRYPDLNTGWLVSVDTDVDNACRYADGKLVVSYIQEMYRDEGQDVLEIVNGDSSNVDDIDVAEEEN